MALDTGSIDAGYVPRGGEGRPEAREARRQFQQRYKDADPGRAGNRAYRELVQQRELELLHHHQNGGYHPHTGGALGRLFDKNSWSFKPIERGSMFQVDIPAVARDMAREVGLEHS